ncbi:hypothetical protein MTYP_01224 [Methylophilaceae bacterium]|nr:hypothetical protein MTYP_01224 [Methylophilaceae bacterium]
MMRDALLADLSAIDGLELICCHDRRLPAPPVKYPIMLDVRDDVWQVWSDAIEQSDAVWMIAPETSGVLLRLTELAAAKRKLLLGCQPSAVKLASSKYETCRALQRAGISAIPTYTAREWMAAEWQDEASGRWVVKPDDGVSCDDAACFDRVGDVIDWLKQGRESTHIVQPYRHGVAGSLSLLCRDGQAWLLSCNRQKVVMESGRFVYRGGIINGLSEYWEPFDRLARQIAGALPDLAGYVGVDVVVVVDDNPARIEVLEINPRLTTSYAGLGKATGRNPAELVLAMFGVPRQDRRPFKLPPISRNIIEITL